MQKKVYTVSNQNHARSRRDGRWMMVMMMMIPSPSKSMAGHAAYHMEVITCTNYSLTDVPKKCVLDLRLY